VPISVVILLRAAIKRLVGLIPDGRRDGDKESLRKAWPLPM
jgi:hypothetical protein